MATIIDGKKIARLVKDEVGTRAASLPFKATLAAVLVGDDEASATYVRLKQADAERLGMGSCLDHLPSDTSPDKLAEILSAHNENPDVHGILLQLPLPSHLDSDRFISMIDPVKDVDGLHPVSQGLLMQGRPSFVSCTPLGVVELLTRSGIETRGANVVVVGRSVLVGRPLSVLLSLRDHNATVTVCHTATRDLQSITRQADILIVAAGSAAMIGKDHVTQGQTVIDVGTNSANGKLVGDVAFDEVEPVVAAISPVPGGVGPMTRAMLMQNTVLAAERSLAATR